MDLTYSRSGGLGYEVARRLLAANATVVVACRNASKCEVARQSLLASHTGVAYVHSAHLDLNDLRSVRAFEATVKRLKLPRLALLINNAGVAAQYPVQVTADGVERTFQANYLGHYALTTGLLPLLKRASREGQRARVVHLTSGAHRGAPTDGVPLDLAAINDERIGGYARYGMAKLASLVFSRELARRHGAFLISHAVHPGVVATQMLRQPNFEAVLGATLGGVAWRLAQVRNAIFAYSVEQAAISVLFAATAPELETAENGQLFVPIATPWQPRHPMAMDAAAGAKLWAFSESLVTGLRPKD